MTKGWLLALAPVALAAGASPFFTFVPDDEMAPSFYAGDLVMILPRAPSPGDVVAVVDPLDPSRWTLRRVEAIGGAIRYDEGVFHSSAGDEKVLEMGRDPDFVTLKEGPHLMRVAVRPVRWSMPEVGVADDAAFLGADNRDEAMDSRWWGPFPLDALQGTVVLRVGPTTNRWRGWLSYSW
ncbi:MAG: S26 family signal peptidase [Myxococcota bacterium]